MINPLCMYLPLPRVSTLRPRPLASGFFCRRRIPGTTKASSECNDLRFVNLTFRATITRSKQWGSRLPNGPTEPTGLSLFWSSFGFFAYLIFCVNRLYGISLDSDCPVCRSRVHGPWWLFSGTESDSKPRNDKAFWPHDHGHVLWVKGG